MPNIIDALKSAGVEVPEGVTNESLFSVLKESSDFEGLSAKNRELLGKNAELKAKDAEREAKEQERENSELKLARENGDLKSELEILRKRAEAAEEKELKRAEALRLAAHESAQKSVTEIFDDKMFAKYLAKSDVVTELNELGEPVSKYMLDGVEYTELSEWKEAAAKVPEYASRMPVGGESNSPSSQGSTQHQPPKDKKPSEYSEAERVALFRSDPTKFNELFGRK